MISGMEVVVGEGNTLALGEVNEFFMKHISNKVRESNRKWEKRERETILSGHLLWIKEFPNGATWDFGQGVLIVPDFLRH